MRKSQSALRAAIVAGLMAGVGISMPSANYPDSSRRRTTRGTPAELETIRKAEEKRERKRRALLARSKG